MFLSDSVFYDTPQRDIKKKSSSRVEYHENIEKLAEILRHTMEPMDYYQITDALDFNMIERVYSRYVYHYPDRAKRCVVALLAQFPGQFEMTTVEKINKRGSTYFAPAVQAVRKGVI